MDDRFGTTVPLVCEAGMGAKPPVTDEATYVWFPPKAAVAGSPGWKPPLHPLPTSKVTHYRLPPFLVRWRKHAPNKVFLPQMNADGRG
jgi:hypothetical protein